MKPAIRKQIDTDQQKYSDATAIDFSEDDRSHAARQEMKHETDANVILSKFGVDVLTRMRPVQYGEQNFTIDRQDAIRMVQESKEAYERLPESLKEKYPTWADVLAAVDSGELTKERLHELQHGPKQGGDGGRPKATDAGGAAGGGAAVGGGAAGDGGGKPGGEGAKP